MQGTFQNDLKKDNESTSGGQGEDMGGSREGKSFHRASGVV